MRFLPRICRSAFLSAACVALLSAFLAGCHSSSPSPATSAATNSNASGGPAASTDAGQPSSPAAQSAPVAAPIAVPPSENPLTPPPGARVAIVEFEDMECPVCGNFNPTLRQAANDYKIPWIRHDFPLPQHAWSRQAAIDARWFDTKSKKLGDDYRDQVFANQASITTPEVLRQFTEKYAADHQLQMPFAVDPQGALAAEVQADSDLGKRIGIDHTPTVWIVARDSRGAPYVEVKDRSKLFEIIDQALADTRGSR